MSDVESKVKQIITEQLDVDAAAVTADASLIDDLGADSLDTVDLIMSIEEAFDIEVPDGKAETLSTVKDICALIEEMVA